MDYVYVCKDGENEELRYSIRSVVANSNVSSLWVVGGKPDWYTGNYIPVNKPGTKMDKVVNNLKAIIDSTEISEEFVLMNDDFFILDKIDSVPDLHGGSLMEKINLYLDIVPRSSYTRHLHKTYNWIKRRGVKEPLDYELHVPMKMTKTNLKKVIDYPVLWRSAYGNLFDVGGIEIEDVKVYKRGPLLYKSFDYKSKLSTFLSSNDDAFDMLYEEILKDRFTSKTQFEK